METFLIGSCIVVLAIVYLARLAYNAWRSKRLRKLKITYTVDIPDKGLRIPIGKALEECLKRLGLTANLVHFAPSLVLGSLNEGVRSYEDPILDWEEPKDLFIHVSFRQGNAARPGSYLQLTCWVNGKPLPEKCVIASLRHDANSIWIQGMGNACFDTDLANLLHWAVSPLQKF